MAKGIIYVMTTAVSGLIKIGKTKDENYIERMRFLESNGYYNVAGLKRYFAIEVEDFDDKESLLHDIFSKHQVGSSELFALDQDLVKQLLLSFEGKVIYPQRIDKENEFDEVTNVRKQGALFNFYNKGLKKGDVINFISDETISAVVVGEREVEYGGQIWKLSPLTYKIYEEKGRLNNSGAYQGASHWKFHEKKLLDIPNQVG